MKILIHSTNIGISEKTRYRINKVIEAGLARFDMNVNKVDVFLKDVNGPKGGVDKQCTLTISGKNSCPIVVSSESDSLLSVVKKSVFKGKNAWIKHMKKSFSNRRRKIMVPIERIDSHAF